MGLFKKKAGGTFFGNLLRGVANKATGGLLGTGANRIEVGQTKTNAQLAAEAQTQEQQIAQSNAQFNAGGLLAGGIQNAAYTANPLNFQGSQMFGINTSNPFFMLALVGGLVYFLTKKK